MMIREWLIGVALASASAAAAASPPSYDFIELDYVGVNRHDPTYDFQGGSGQLSARVQQYLFLEGSYQFLQSDTFTQGLAKGRLQEQTIAGGLGGRIPLARNLLDLTVAADYIHVSLRQRDGFEGVFPDQNGSGVQGKLGLRINLPYFEAIPGVRYTHIFGENEWAFGAQLLGCPGYGVCLTGSYEYLKESKDSRFTGGFRFYYD